MLSNVRLREIQDMVERARIVGTAVQAPGAAKDDCHEMATLLTALALGVVPVLLAEIERLRAKRPDPVMVKMDSQRGYA